MLLRCLSGRARAVRNAVASWRKKAKDDDARAVIIVPAQLTLQAERDCIESLDIAGSFNIQVYSPQRLFKRIFEEVGEPERARVDEQGKVMLMHIATLKCENELKWYMGAVDKPGFAGKLVEQITEFKQSGLNSEDISEIANSANGAFAKKLGDLALLYKAYEEMLSEGFMDTEDELDQAVKRAGDTEFLRGCRVCVYGFDILTSTLDKLIIGLYPTVKSVDVAMINCEDPDSRDYQVFEPVNRSLNMLLKLAAENGIRAVTKTLSEPVREKKRGLDALEREMYCVPPRQLLSKVNDVQMAVTPNPESEAEFVVSIIRRICRVKGWRYRDFAIALASNDEYSRDALNRAFMRAKTPLFLSSGRPADRHSLSRALLSAMRAASRGYRLNDMVGYLRSGFSGLDDDECDLLVNYAVASNMRGKRWIKPIDDETEPLRQKAVKPIQDLADRVQNAADTKGKLAAVFAFLEDINAGDKLESMRESLQGLSMPVWAAEGAQVWNRIVSALDQMYELMKNEKVDMRLIYDCLSRALAQSQVKALPQSGDAVEAGALEHLRGKPVRALFVMGAVETSPGTPTGLLDESEISRIACKSMTFTTLTRRDLTRMQKLNMLSLMALTQDYMLVTRPMSDTSGRALPAGGLMRGISSVLPQVPLRGVSDADELMSACYEQGEIALCRLPVALNAESYGAKRAARALSSMDEYGAMFEKVMSAKHFKVYSERLPGELIRPAYGSLSEVSVSRLERFAACPFRHFARYALRPEEFRTFELSPRDAGVFYHEALEAFMNEHSSELGTITPEQSGAFMDDITARLIETTMNVAFEPGELEKAEAAKMRTVARRAADIVTRQFDGSKFMPVDVEADISTGTARVALDDAELVGRIDRVDVLNADEDKYIRVVDYKKGNRSVSLPEVYAGLQLQLVMYLASAVKRYGAKPAGMFYFSVSDPLIDTRDRDPETIEKARGKLLRLDGLSLNDKDVVSAMAQNPELAINVAFNKDGTLRKSNSLLTGEDFEAIIKRCMRFANEIIKQIRMGDTDISPAATAQTVACDYCEYKTICEIDDMFDGANIRQIEYTKAADVLAALRAGDDEQNNAQSGE